ncbi:cell division protein FtsQ/DivIB [Alteribacillus iranensis]|uniref:Cell division protein DivIB n=1 Tax=Alteribacillus iranensis TaxID=930128 RepID=A0A1I2AAG9_9BACI|nr:FtsQ-type POTRA domain-containing protein [Alteribacillus iranensis]SFE40856.1 cell division protein FtsQ [Alteribacillus iranensis]
MPDDKIVKAEDHIPALKEKRRKKTNRRLITYLSIFFILILLVVYFQSPLSHVRNITVEGSQLVEDKKIIDTSMIQTGTSMWQLEISEAESHIAELDEIKEVSVDRNLPSTVEIHVTEHERIAYVEDGDRYVPVLQNGTVLNAISTGSLSADAPVLKNFNDSSKLEAFTNELSKLGDGILNRISEVHYLPENEEENELFLYMNDGIEVVTYVNDFAENMGSYPAISREINPDTPGVLHMKMSAYFESWEEEEVEERLPAEVEQAQ